MRSQPVTAAELDDFALFHGLPEEERAAVAAAATWLEPADGEVLYDEGGTATTMFLVERGTISLGVQRDGRRVVVGTLGAGEVLNWSCLRDEPLSLTTARTSGPARVVAIPARALLAFLESGRPAGVTVMRRLFGVAAVHLDAARDQMLRQGREGVITAG